MFQRHPFSIVSCFRRFVSRDKISQYFDRFICQRLYYDAEIALNDLKKSDLKMSALNVRTTYHIYYFTFKLYFFVKASIIEKIYLIQTNFGFIVCYDIDNVHIEVISIQKLINIDCRKLVEILVLTLKK